ncbi:MAG: hypothetical protein J6B90_03855 [Lachnospiraceae bacterium]|nr:hypothetical protein [Lachnospiraceae bacterium]
MTNMENRDYKYIMQDVSTIYLGARYTYEELTNEEEIPFKIKSLVNRYIKQELNGENLSLESHFFYMEPQGFAYQTYLQMKTKVKISILEEKKGFGGKVKKVYATQTMKLQDFVKIPPAEKEKQGIMIQEISLSKLALMTNV